MIHHQNFLTLSIFFFYILIVDAKFLNFKQGITNMLPSIISIVIKHKFQSMWKLFLEENKVHYF